MDPKYTLSTAKILAQLLAAHFEDEYALTVLEAEAKNLHYVFLGLCNHGHKWGRWELRNLQGQARRYLDAYDVMLGNPTWIEEDAAELAQFLVDHTTWCLKEGFHG